MKISRNDLWNFSKHADYIKERADVKVYADTIYFGDQSNYMSWNQRYEPLSTEKQDRVLKAINALCNTDFEFMDETLAAPASQEQEPVVAAPEA